MQRHAMMDYDLAGGWLCSLWLCSCDNQSIRLAGGYDLEIGHV